MVAALVSIILLRDKKVTPPTPVVELVFDGDSQGLTATQIVPTLDSPIQREMHTIWCASFLAAWKALETDLAQEPLSLQGAPEVARALEEAADPRPHIPEESLYVAADWNHEGITDQIKQDLAQKFPSQAQPTLAETVAAVEERIETTTKHDGLGPNDVLLVPEMAWHIAHRFAELEGQAFTNAQLKGQSIDLARQDIQFRLDRSGAELKSEAKTYMLPVPTYYVFNRPFILYMKKRAMPYFVMWVQNAELLNKW